MASTCCPCPPPYAHLPLHPSPPLDSPTNALWPLPARQIALQSARRLTTSSVARSSPKDVHPGYLRLREQYAKFQVQDGVPVHLKGGPADKILASLTYLACACAVATVSYTLFYKMAFPQKKN